MTILILYYASGSADDEDTLEGVKGIFEACLRLGHTAVKIQVTKDNWQEAIKVPADVVFNFVEDEAWDLYLKVGLGLEKLKRAQVGHDRQIFKYATQKTLVKKTLINNGLNTPAYKIFKSESSLNDKGLTYPLITKPVHEHAGIGISQSSVVRNTLELQKQVAYILRNFHCDAIAEKFVSGREVHATVMGNGKNIFVLPLCEIRFIGKFKDNWSVYTYESKWDKKSWEYRDARVDSPAKLPIKVTKTINKLALKAYKVFKCRDIARFDFRIDKYGKPYVIDVNINPSLNVYDEQDATVASVKAKGWTYDEFMEKLLEITAKRFNSN